MPIISQLTIFPIKSCGGVNVTEAHLAATGLLHQGIHDREWMLVNADGQFLSQREFPVMARIHPEIRAGIVHVHTPDMPELILSEEQQIPRVQRQVQIWDDQVHATDCGDAAANWFSHVLDTTCRLMRFDKQEQRYASTKWTEGELVPTLFSDGYPLLVISEASLDDLNRRLQTQGLAKVPMNRFRPNIVLADIEAYEEDYAASFDVNGGIQLRPVKPCPRCPIPAIDQNTGEIGHNPVDTLQSYRTNPLLDGGITFGMNTIVVNGHGHMLHVGDQVSMEIAF
ncbi:MAG: MOSC N-terminal beta barrel domain-containing protein [Burkholderiales bacterium]|nr:MOSC N-terminal beta barrel domain-containing protein [Burkholderiales bacterium]